MQWDQAVCTTELKKEVFNQQQPVTNDNIILAAQAEPTSRILDYMYPAPGSGSVHQQPLIQWDVCVPDLEVQPEHLHLSTPTSTVHLVTRHDSGKISHSRKHPPTSHKHTINKLCLYISEATANRIQVQTYGSARVSQVEDVS